ncbi:MULTISPECIES: Fe-S cluster assembly protein SufD [Helcobacillus]|uniref:Fe-S cluster assembly protein SufD n=1 Tax=Helcobacillus massiliensis TaxID=521392 RepID=A0A839QP90_9MICO|nr:MULTISPECIES: Fe-S cluster assembly protein SufD [Helcobacillus]MBB3022313.1 Fe-S cluster assembly protein SufD [Helcobacillus massiliensis]MCG7426466.1 Fe-S cluster assembly protein SufD [Helcobacillus sp. ACRRO]MDK7741023.1 Fe-S cluster assembly protein SufD [Helcobacillus massiliensis]WOO93835.1 Fe-S cluster assembly protein SufD [Helcobacillus massiliensis]
MTVTDHSKAELESEGIALGAHTEDSRAYRYAAFGVDNHEIPTGREEEWRFASLREIYPLLQATETTVSEDVVAFDVDEVEGITVGSLGADEAPRNTLLVPEDRIAAAAAELTANALHLKAPKNTVVEQPLRVEITGKDGSTASHAAIVLETEESARATYILNHTGTALFGENVEMVVGDNSEMTVISLQDWDDDAIHVATHVAHLGRDAKLKHIVVSLGGRAVRVNSTSKFNAPGSEIEQIGLYFADDKQHLEHRLFVDHAAPKCTSDVTYKGALQGKGARSVWVGDVLIRKEAEGTDTYELNRNLVLTEGARADSVPNLEIETGEIEGAGHAAATGRFDDEQLFYLRSRGIPEIEARRLVVRGFFQELIQKIDVPEIREHLTDSIEDELRRSMN